MLCHSLQQPIVTSCVPLLTITLTDVALLTWLVSPNMGSLSGSWGVCKSTINMSRKVTVHISKVGTWLPVVVMIQKCQVCVCTSLP